MVLTPIQEFYRGRSVLITGATGFCGKVLLEKLLRSCEDIGNIYLLMRPTKVEDLTTRLTKIFDEPLFDTVKTKVKNSMERKISLIQGDVNQTGLGLSTEDRQELCREVSIVFHVAATTKFNENLKTALQTNVIGTQEVVNMCKEMPRLAEIQEQVYPPPHDLKGISDSVNWLTEAEFTAMEPTILGRWPNTYSYTKALAEQVINESRGDLPVAIFRPSIVISTWKDPIPGWIDNTKGPTKVQLALSLGALRSVYADRNKVADLVPVDMVVNAMIAAAWETSFRRNGETKIYNFVSNIQQPITWGGYMDTCKDYTTQNPSIHAMWYYNMISCGNIYKFLATSFLLDFIPACLKDLIPFLTTAKHKNMDTYFKFVYLSQCLAKFSTKDWKFHDSNVRSLLSILSAEDQELFYFDLTQLQWRQYLEDYVAGMRYFLLKEDTSTLPAARKRYRMLYAVHIFCILGLILLSFRMIQ